MLVQVLKREHCDFDLSKPLRNYKTIQLWSSDGWMYDLTSKIRRQFLTTSNSGFLEMKQEKVVCPVLSDVEYDEQVEVSILSETPLVWMEKNNNFCEIYASASPNTKHK